MVFQYPLAVLTKSGDPTGLCGRGVRMRELSALEAQEIAAEAIEPLKDATQMRQRQEQIRQQVINSLVAVTVQSGLTREKIMAAKGDEWHTLTQQELEADPTWAVGVLFGRAKDWDAITDLWLRLHTISKALVDEIVGEGCAVTTEESPRTGGGATG